MVPAARIWLGIALSTLPALSSARSAEQHIRADALGSPVLRGNRHLQDSTCSNGLPGISASNDNGEACCPLSCGLCGGVGCGAEGRDNKECCINGVLNNQDDCSVTNAAPCEITETATPTEGYLGCFQDGKSTNPAPSPDPERIFPARMEDSNEMDSEFCKGLCLADGGDYDYYGTQFGRECWCGAGTAAETYLKYGDKLDDSSCDVACFGDDSENCGGSTIMSVYAFGDDPVTPTPAPDGDSTCSNGLPGYSASNDNGEACCPLSCGLCGGAGCGTGGRNTECCINGVLNNQDDCSVTNAAPCEITDGTGDVDACDPNPCNSGSCTVDPAGGHMCSCPSGWGGMNCQIDTTGLKEFKIQLTFTINESVEDDGVVWTDEEMTDFRAWADRWEGVITHVPCGDGILPIEAEWTAGFILNPPSPRADCPQISAGGKLSNSKGLKGGKERDGVWESFVTHEMGHGIGFGYLWGKCNNCVIGDPEPLDGSWKPEECPAVYSEWLDLSGEPDGTVANIVETDIVGLTGECVHWDYDTVPGELNNKGTTHRDNPGGITYMSKLTLAAMEDIGYIVDPSKAEPFSLP